MGYKMDICQVAALRIRKMRLEKNMTIDDLAEKCDVSTQTIKLIEAGRRNFKIKTLYTIANSLNVSSDYLIGRIDKAQIGVCHFEKLTNTYFILRDGSKSKNNVPSHLSSKKCYRINILYRSRK